MDKKNFAFGALLLVAAFALLIFGPKPAPPAPTPAPAPAEDAAVEETAPRAVLEKANKATADKAKEQLEAAGAKVTVK